MKETFRDKAEYLATLPKEKQQAVRMAADGYRQSDKVGYYKLVKKKDVGNA